MLHRFAGAVKLAAKEENFVAIVGAAIALVVTGTVAYTLGEGWSLSDGFYFAVATLTTSSIADPDLVLTHDALKIFTTIYILTGIGILVEVARQLGVGFVRMHEEQSTGRHAKRQARRDRRHKDDPPEAQSPG
ncbi:MAG: potassium channel family protein [Solirubrobacterales bacterium]